MTDASSSEPYQLRQTWWVPGCLPIQCKITAVPCCGRDRRAAPLLFLSSLSPPSKPVSGGCDQTRHGRPSCDRSIVRFALRSGGAPTIAPRSTRTQIISLRVSLRRPLLPNWTPSSCLINRARHPALSSAPQIWI
ncbi:hypothetical protein BHE74_00026293 [Ensete ventricosum]|nr:hypothetical protein GW17_00034439 [Ensete ventricosum]RWW66343.1 hypothetical protein BHE74_00026293 [Ensete ventricosum]RZR96818.1 hypothetical protein BHM03_00025891 [Ensete ventricosum]